MRFLVVDDTLRARQSMRALLAVWHPDGEVGEASNGVEAVRMAEEFRPDLILMDARMPEKGGLAAMCQIKAQWPQIKVIILSVFLDYQAPAMEAGADGFYSKSDPPEKLRRMLDELF